MNMQNSTAAAIVKSIQSNISSTLSSPIANASTIHDTLAHLNETQDLLAVLPTASTSTMAVVASIEELKWTSSMIPPLLTLTSEKDNNNGTSIIHTIIARLLPPSSTEVPNPKSSTDLPDSESVAFILVPLILIVAIALVSGIALYCISKRKKLDRLRHHLIPMYTFSPGEEEEWGELLNQAEQRHKY